MKKILFILLFVMLLVPYLQGQQHADESIFHKKISIEKRDLTVAEVLNIISAQSGVFFSYDASVVVSDRQINLKVSGTIYQTLSSLFDTSLFRFIEKEDHIIIALIENGFYADSAKITRYITSNDIEHITITGQVVDSKKQNPIPFAAIVIKNTPFGTITNIDGEFILKISPDKLKDTIVFSSLGYSPKEIPANLITDNVLISLRPSTILIKEIEVSPVSPEFILDKVFENIKSNYVTDLMMLKAFYRETLKQDDQYINISEAIIEILKAPYYNSYKEDRVRLLKNRQSTSLNLFKWVDFKLQGGPQTITQLDLVKTMESFLDPEYRQYYNYEINKVFWHLNHPVYVIDFKPIKGFGLYYEGEMFVDRETFVVMHIDFRMGKPSLKLADKSLIKKKPRGYKVKSLSLEYHVEYTQSKYKWCMSSARASAAFKIRGRKEKLNSTFHSVSEILITDIEKSQIKRFPKGEVFTINDVFTDNIQEYDGNFWGNFNIIKPDADLRQALKYFNVNSSIKSVGNQ